MKIEDMQKLMKYLHDLDIEDHPKYCAARASGQLAGRPAQIFPQPEKEETL